MSTAPALRRAAAVVLVVPGEPVAKGRPRFNTRTGHAYTDARTEAAEEAVGRCFQAAYPGFEPLTGPLLVAAAFHESGRAKDADNMLKLCLDALAGLAFVNDRQITQLYAEVRRNDPNPRTIVLIEEVGDAA